MKNDRIIFKYVLCFIKSADKMLLVLRNKEPWKDHWNGIGGHIDKGETANQAIKREVFEEVQINLDDAGEIYFSGIVTWDRHVESAQATEPVYGMYNFIIELPHSMVWEGEKPMSEGVLAWKPLNWVLDKNNKQVAHNIPYFLPDMLKSKTPSQYHCVFENNTFVDIMKYRLPNGITVD